MREIIFDTETTGLDPASGHRVVEIGCVEVLNLIPTGQTFHTYINPDRDMPEEAFRVHGLSSEFLAGNPRFAEIVDGLLAFIGEEVQLVAHNASFDFAFLNAELARASRPALRAERIVDTLALARRRHPGASNRLDDLCLRYRIDNKRRTKHGALLDAELLAEVYAELRGGRQATLGLLLDGPSIDIAAGGAQQLRPTPLAPRLTAADIATHAEFLATFAAQALWREYGAL